MSTVQIHYGGQRYQLAPDAAENLLYKLQIGQLKVTEGASTITTRLAGGELLRLWLSPGIPLAIVESGEDEPDHN